VTLMLWCDA